MNFIYLKMIVQQMGARVMAVARVMYGDAWEGIEALCLRLVRYRYPIGSGQLKGFEGIVGQIDHQHPVL